MVGGYDQTSITDTRIRRKHLVSTNSTSVPTNITSTTSTSYTYTDTFNSSYYTITTRRDLAEEAKKVKELRKKEKVLRMKKTWNKEVKELTFKPIRPSGQLRGVCFNGRGWA